MPCLPQLLSPTQTWPLLQPRFPLIQSMVNSLTDSCWKFDWENNKHL